MMKLLFPLAFALAQAPVAAATYAEKLEALEKRIDVAFDARLGAIEKAQAVRWLYDAVLQGAVARDFGRDRLVQGVHVLGPRRLLEGEALNEQLRLRENRLFVAFDGRAWNVQAAGLGAEAEILKGVRAKEAALKRLLPAFNFRRAKEPAFPGDTTTNVAYARLLGQLEEFLVANPAARGDWSRRFGEVRIYDSIKIYDSQSRFEIRPMTDGSSELEISFGKSSERLQTPSDPARFLRGTQALLAQGFRSFRTYLGAEADVLNALDALTAHLAASGDAARLRAGGVKGFLVDSGYATRESLLERGELVVGTTRADVERIIDLLF